MQLARAPNRKRLSGNAEGVGLPRLGSTGACSSITPSFSSTSHFASCTYLALCPSAFLLHSLLSCEANTLHLCRVLCHFFPVCPFSGFSRPSSVLFSSQSFNPLQFYLPLAWSTWTYSQRALVLSTTLSQSIRAQTSSRCSHLGSATHLRCDL